MYPICQPKTHFIYLQVLHDVNILHHWIKKKKMCFSLKIYSKLSPRARPSGLLDVFVWVSTIQSCCWVIIKALFKRHAELYKCTEQQAVNLTQLRSTIVSSVTSGFNRFSSTSLIEIKAAVRGAHSDQIQMHPLPFLSSPTFYFFICLFSVFCFWLD